MTAPKAALQPELEELKKLLFEEIREYLNQVDTESTIDNLKINAEPASERSPTKQTRLGSNSVFLGCSNYPRCKWTESLEQLLA